MKEKYHIRAYIYEGEVGEVVGNYLNSLIDSGKVDHLNTVNGKDGLICFYDLLCSREQVWRIYHMGGIFLPMNHYEDFIITCPEGERIDDDMILRDYSDIVLSGYNIKCKHGYRTAVVKMI
jgi:hypothetical protein